MKTTHYLLSMNLLFILSINIKSQDFTITKDLNITKLSDHVYIHISNNNNGIIYTDNGEAIIVSTPETNELTEELIKWTRTYLKIKIVGYVIDRWHPDAMGGLEIVKKLGIKSYANELTREIAKTKNLPVPEIGFNQKLELKIGKEKLICHYFGEAHTTDGIVAWVPKEKILFGGNEIRSYNGWVGNIGDANLEEWSATIEKVKNEYGNAKIVIPGHGKYGGTELIDYTIELYQPNKWGELLRLHNIERLKIFNNCGDIFEIARQDSTSKNIRFLKDAIVFIDNGNRYIKVSTPFIEHQIETKTVKSPYGRMQIYNKLKQSTVPVTDVYYENLIISLRDDEVGIVIIMKNMIR